MASEPTFEEVAQKIIKRSIRSAICIDDMFEQPYMTEEEILKRNKALRRREKNKDVKLHRRIPCKLYQSFRSEGACDLDIYNFKSIKESWHPEYMLNNKDLMVIDWELNGDGEYGSTLKILSQAIDGKEYPSIPFIIIYTHKPKAVFKQIVDALLGIFNPYGLSKDEMLRNIHAALVESFGDKIEASVFSLNNLNDWLESIEVKLLYGFWYIVDDTLRAQIRDEIWTSFDKTFMIEYGVGGKGPKTDSRFKKAFKNSWGLSIDKSLERLYYLLKASSELVYAVERIDTKEIGLRINGSIVTIFSKNLDDTGGEGVKPEEVFRAFSEMVCKDPHNFMTLLSLEMKDRFRDDLSKIGANISSLDERAFFHHHNGYASRSKNPKNEFFDFLLKCWTDEIESYNLNNLPEVFNALEEYAAVRGYATIDGNEIKKELGELGFRLSTVKVNDRVRKAPQLTFGDIFKITRKSKGESEYLMCITPLCVCVDACKKIDDNFYFVKSESVQKFVESPAASKIERGFYSLVRIAEDVHAIDWGNECKPFTMHIKENNIKKLKTNYSGESITLEHITTAKQNFAQRIANKAFSYGTAVGIDLPHV